MKRECLPNCFGIFTAMIILLFSIAFVSGCTIRTSKGDEYKILDDLKEKNKDNNKDTSIDMTENPDGAGSEKDFTELSDDEKNDLASDKNGDKEAIETGEIKTSDPNEDNRSRVISGRPSGVLPKQVIMYPVPVIAQNMLFDPEKRHRSNRMAAISLTKHGVQALENNKVDLAIGKFQKAISVDPKFGYAYFYFARARFVQQEWDQVVALTDKALHLLKDNTYISRAHLMQAQAYANRKLYIQALASCERAINTDKTNVPAKLLKSKLGKLFR